MLFRSTNLDPIFSILQDLPDAHLLSVATDSCISFSSSAGPLAENLFVICANELAQASLSETRYRLELEVAANKLKADKETSAKQLTPSAGEGMLVSLGGETTMIEVDVSRETSNKTMTGECSSRQEPPGTRRRRAKSAAPQGRRPVTHQARANGEVI